MKAVAPGDNMVFRYDDIKPGQPVLFAGTKLGPHHVGSLASMGITECSVFDAVTVGIDFTARELQKKLRAEGKPWELCKGFDGSAAIGDWVPLEKFRDVQAIHFHLDINGKTVQEGCTSDMLYRVDELIAYISQFFTLKTGDILFTGTPAGVGPVNIDDKLEGYLEDRKVLEFSCK